MKTATSAAVVGGPLNRVDGRLKVMGAAPYPLDVTEPHLAHSVIVQSTVTSGRILTIAASAAERAPGVLAVVTHANAPELARGPMTPLGPSPQPPFQSDEILHYGQHIAMVIAETLEQAHAAAALIEVTYEPGTPILSFDDPRTERVTHPWTPDQKRGDVSHDLASADVRVDATYITAENTHNPIGLFATVAAWNGDALTVHDTTQWPHGVRESLAQAFEIDADRVRVLTPFVGGAFGAGLRVWPHVALAVLGARVTKRPVKLVLTRAQMFTSLGHRPNSLQRISMGATSNGQLVAINHESTSSMAMADDFFNPITPATPEAYACPNVSARATQVRLNIPPPSWMRAPGHAEGQFALESALDELSYALGIDPIELRIRNHAAVHPETGLPWSSNAVLECYKQGAGRFGWSARRPKPGSMRDGHTLVGYGMARALLSAYQAPCKARASVDRDGTAFVRSAATDIGAGTYTVMTTLAAEILGFPVERVRFGLGDTEMPNSPQQGGSGITGALGNAVHAACVNLVQAFVDLASSDQRSPLRGCTLAMVTVRDGGIQVSGDSARFETYADILARHDLDEMTRDGESKPPGDTTSDATVAARCGQFVPYTAEATSTKALAGSFAAHFVEVHVDSELGTVRVARVVSAVDGGRILNEKTARSQIIGGIVGGIGMALLEETVSDSSGRLVNTSLGDYLVATNADVPNIDVLFVGEPDPMTAIGTKGIGELALIGMAPAIANAVYHATGTRIRSLPISLEKVLGLEGPVS
jgi:CO/xanthine dehydrogenase Mo-binding subunit